MSHLEDLNKKYKKEYPNDFVKIVVGHEDINSEIIPHKGFDNEITALNRLKNSNLAPKLKDTKYLGNLSVYKDDKWLFNMSYHLLVMENVGISLLEKYGKLEDDTIGGYVSEGFKGEHFEGFEELFGPEYPLSVKRRVLEILFILTDNYYIYHEDIKPSNFVIDKHNVIRIIDFESSTIL